MQSRGSMTGMQMREQSPEAHGPDGLPAIPVGTLVEGLREIIRELPLSGWILGEISNLSQPRSGHIYFTLKDNNGQIRCALFRGNARKIAVAFADGDEVFVQARPDLYAERGEVQLIVSDLVPVGLGALQKRFEELKARLLAEGLFDTERKKRLPAFPATIGVVTSGTGAAIRDICQVAARRWPLARLLITPVRVQGEGSAEEVAAAIGLLDSDGRADLLIVGRGGGSLEDLWAFNEEVTVRAIATCSLPVISAVGHETDTTLTDLVADLRAATPSAGAELATPDRDEILQLLAGHQQRATHLIQHRVQSCELRLAQAARRLTHPGERTLHTMQKLDELTRRCDSAMREQYRQRFERFARAAGRLEDLSPLKVLGRGFAMATDEKGKLIVSRTQVPLGAHFTLQLADGLIEARRIGKTRQRKPAVNHEQGQLF